MGKSAGSTSTGHGEARGNGQRLDFVFPIPRCSLLYKPYFFELLPEFALQHVCLPRIYHGRSLYYRWCDWFRKNTLYTLFGGRCRCRLAIPLECRQHSQGHTEWPGRRPWCIGDSPPLVTSSSCKRPSPSHLGRYCSKHRLLLREDRIQHQKSLVASITCQHLLFQI